MSNYFTDKLSNELIPAFMKSEFKGVRYSPIRFHQDDRAIRFADVFPEIGRGDINVSLMYPGAIAAWHRHKKQVDYQICVLGNLKIGLCDKPSKEGGKVEWHYLGGESTSFGPLVIPPGIWHGSYNFTNEPAVLLYHITEKYDGTDEERLTIKEMGFNWERIVK